MKKLIALFLLVIPMFSVVGQDMLSFTGGYSFATVKESDVNATGWKVTGHYEFLPKDTKWSFGISVGYLQLTASDEAAGIDYKIETIPFYGAPKYYFGGEKFKGFVKLAIGAQTSKVERTGNTLDKEDKDLGFALGGGVGATYWLSESFFLVADYELLRLSNGYISNGLLNTFSAGVGFKL